MGYQTVPETMVGLAYVPGGVLVNNYGCDGNYTTLKRWL